MCERNSDDLLGDNYVVLRKHRGSSSGRPQSASHKRVVSFSADSKRCKSAHRSRFTDVAFAAQAAGRWKARLPQYLSTGGDTGSDMEARLTRAAAPQNGPHLERRRSSLFILDDDSDDDVPKDPTAAERSRLQREYTRICEKQGSRPCSRYTRQIDDHVIDLSNSLSGLKDVRSLCIHLTFNTHVMELNVSGNDLSGKGLQYLSEALSVNTSVVDLNLAECNIDLEGLEALANVLLDMKPLKVLDLSQNKLGRKHAEILAAVLKKNDYIEDLRLAGNELEEAGGVVIGRALVGNVGIRKLDLSWNHLRREGARTVCNALRFNQTLEVLNLSWNGLSREGCEALGQVLPFNHTLRSLDISCNRINIVALMDFLKGMEKNDTIQSLSIDQNPLTTEGAILMVHCVTKSPCTQLTDIHLRDIPINPEFVDAVNDLLKVKDIRVYHRDPNRKKIMPIIQERTLKDYDPAMILFEYMKQENLRLIDLFRTFDTDSSQTVTREEMKDGFESINMPISEDALDSLFKKLDLNQNDEIEYDEYRMGYRQALLEKRRKSEMNDESTLHHLSRLVTKALKEKREFRGAKRRRTTLTCVFELPSGQRVHYLMPVGERDP